MKYTIIQIHTQTLPLGLFPGFPEAVASDEKLEEAWEQACMHRQLQNSCSDEIEKLTTLCMHGNSGVSPHCREMLQCIIALHSLHCGHNMDIGQSVTRVTVVMSSLANQ